MKTKQPNVEPSIEGLLTPEELLLVLKLKQFITRIQDAIDTANHEAARSGLTLHDGTPLRKIEMWPAALLANDLSQVMFSHELAEKRIREAAFAAVERLAA